MVSRFVTYLGGTLVMFAVALRLESRSTIVARSDGMSDKWRFRRNPHCDFDCANCAPRGCYGDRASNSRQMMGPWLSTSSGCSTCQSTKSPHPKAIGAVLLVTGAILVRF
jgi:hypothetical protein